MHDSADILFDASNDSTAVLLHLGMHPNATQLSVHRALATRALLPDESHLRAAAEWMHEIYQHHLRHPVFDPVDLVAALDDKSCLVHRLAWRHAPHIAFDLESPTSPLSDLDRAARFLPPFSSPARGLQKFRDTACQMNLPPGEGPEAEAAWNDNRKQLLALILGDNPVRFLTWPVISRTMFMNDQSVAEAEFRALQRQPDFATRWLPALHEDACGAPARTRLHPLTSNNLIHHAYSLLQFEIHAGKGIADLQSIVEFGGGYGSMARLAQRLGFRGRYVILDLPEFSALQQFFLENVGVVEGMQFISSLEAGPDLGGSADLFLATWSFSETPLSVRRQLMPLLRRCASWLFAYQDSFGGVDNTRYFRVLTSEAPRRRIADYAIPHLPGNRYLVVNS